MNIQMAKRASDRTDDRRNRDYLRRASLVVEVNIHDEEVATEFFDRYGTKHENFFGTPLSGDTPDGAVASVINKYYEEEFFESLRDNAISEGASNVKFTVRPAFSYSGPAEHPLVVLEIGWQARAERPSEILSEEDTMALVDEDEVSYRFESLVKKAIIFTNQRHEELRTLENTEQLSKWVASAALEAAEEATKYEARLKALRAEFAGRLEALKAEVTSEAITQGQKITTKDWDTHAEEARKEDFNDASIEATPKLWDRFLTAPKGSIGGFGRSRRKFNDASAAKLIKPEDLGFSS